MSQFELILPKMGESVAEATIVKWLKQPGDQIKEDETIVEIATDKVDSEVPSPVSGKLIKHLFSQDQVASVGDIIALIETEEDGPVEPIKHQEEINDNKSTNSDKAEEVVVVDFFFKLLRVETFVVVATAPSSHKVIETKLLLLLLILPRRMNSCFFSSSIF